jgi:very-short-patch-repair endonuclease
MRTRVHNIIDTKDLRRRLRKNSTPAEKVLWTALRNRKLNGEKFTRQHGIGAYVADFYCSKYKLAIEVDGAIHLKKDIVERDRVRSEYIEAWDIIVIRFKNEEILEDLPAVLDSIRQFLK